MIPADPVRGSDLHVTLSSAAETPEGPRARPPSCSGAFTNMLLDIVPVSTVSQVYQTISFKKFFSFFFYVLARPHSMRFLSSLTKD